MKCLILAAGYATRLYPLTESFPKPLLKVGEKSILDWLVDDLSLDQSITEYVVISNHKYLENFQEWRKTKKLKITVIDDGTTSNETRLGAVRDIQLAIDVLSIKEDVLVIAGDNLLDFSLLSFLRYAKTKNSSCVMRYMETSKQRLQKSGVLEIGEEDRVLCLEEKPMHPKSEWACPPFYYYTQEDVPLVKQGIEAGCGVDAPGSYIAWLCRQTKVYAMEMPGKRYDIGNMESYENVQKTYQGILNSSK